MKKGRGRIASYKFMSKSVLSWDWNLTIWDQTISTEDLYLNIQVRFFALLEVSHNKSFLSS
jgi:hypothetical protein